MRMAAWCLPCFTFHGQYQSCLSPSQGRFNITPTELIITLNKTLHHNETAPLKHFSLCDNHSIFVSIIKMWFAMVFWEGTQAAKQWEDQCSTCKKNLESVYESLNFDKRLEVTVIPVTFWLSRRFTQLYKWVVSCKMSD